MKEEDEILKIAGKENPFRVPENYFEQLTPEIMSRLPEKERMDVVRRDPTKWERIRPWVYMAAMFVGAALIIRIGSFTLSSSPSAEESVAKEETEVEMEYINTAVENSMLDDYSLYIYLADSESE